MGRVPGYASLLVERRQEVLGIFDEEDRRLLQRLIGLHAAHPVADEPREVGHPQRVLPIPHLEHAGPIALGRGQDEQPIARPRLRQGQPLRPAGHGVRLPLGLASQLEPEAAVHHGVGQQLARDRDRAAKLVGPHRAVAPRVVGADHVDVAGQRHRAADGPLQGDRSGHGS